MCLVADRRAAVGGGLEVDREAVLDGVAAESGAGAGREQRLVGVAGALGQPCFEHGPGGRDERCSSCLSSFAGGVDVGAGAERDVLAVERDQFGDPQSCLDREREHRVVASAGPGVLVAGGQERVDLAVGEVGQQVALGAFGWDREDASDRVGVFGVVQGEVGEQRVDRREAVVAGRDRVVAFALRWSRNAAISGASRSAMSSALGGLPVSLVAKPSSSRNVSR